MLLVGFIFRLFSDVAGNTIFIVPPIWSSSLRAGALVVILARAGLGLDLDNLRRLSWSVLRLACLPNLSEAIVDAFVATLLFQMPWLWALMLGFVLSAVSPAVVVPTLLRLKDQRYGTKKGIPDLVLAAASFDDVLSISGFGICLGLSLSGGKSVVWDVLRAPVELIAGISVGMLLGWAGCRMTSFSVGGSGGGSSLTRSEREARRLKRKERRVEESLVRTSLLLLMGCLVVLLGKRIHFAGAGALAVIVSILQNYFFYEKQ
jgi:NhaP-type Na+/H+ or K+/H+ antiporter